jgi:arylformamidase
MIQLRDNCARSEAGYSDPMQPEPMNNSIDLQHLYFNRGLVPDHLAIFARWADQSATLRAANPGMTTLTTGPKPRQKVDIFKGAPNSSVVLFVHGGYWQAMDRETHHFAAQGLLSHGITVAFAGYTLAPEASIDQILSEIRASVVALCQHMNRPIVISGHSAGGHIASAILASDWLTTRAALGFHPVSGGLPISGVFELEPLLATTMNQALKLDVVSARRLSTRLWPAPAGQRAIVAVGGDESSEFLRQTRGLVAAWMTSGVDCTELIVPGTNHFTVLDHFSDPESALTRAALALATQMPAGA